MILPDGRDVVATGTANKINAIISILMLFHKPCA